jgi:hypothetical protein
VFECFGPLDADVWAEDRVIPFRAALLGTVGYLGEALVRYRVVSGLSAAARSGFSHPLAKYVYAPGEIEGVEAITRQQLRDLAVCPTADGRVRRQLEARFDELRFRRDLLEGKAKTAAAIRVLKTPVSKRLVAAEYLKFCFPSLYLAGRKTVASLKNLVRHG